MQHSCSRMLESDVSVCKSVFKLEANLTNRGLAFGKSVEFLPLGMYYANLHYLPYRKLYQKKLSIHLA